MKSKLFRPLCVLLQWAGKDRFWIFGAVICSFVSGLCVMAPYYVIYQIMNSALNNILTKKILFDNLFLLSITILLRFVLYGVSVVLSHKGAYGALFRVREKLIEHLGKIPLGNLNERSAGEIKTILNEHIEKLETFLAHQLPDFACYFAGPIAVFVYLLSVNVPLAVISLIPLILAITAMKVMFKDSDQMMGRVMSSLSQLNSILIEYISGMRVIKAFQMCDRSFPRYVDAVTEENEVWNASSKRMGLPYAAYVVIVECGLLLMVPIGGLFFLHGSITASVFLLFVFVGSLYLTELRPLQELASGLTQVLGAIAKVEEIMAIRPYQVEKDAAQSSFPKKHDISFSHVRFSYNGQTDVLRDCNLTIHEGEKIGIVGVSGAGKSTIIELIARFYDVTEGEILIGGKDIREIDYDKLLQNISIVFQQSFLSRGSVFENIQMGSSASLDAVRGAAKLAQIDDFIMSLPDGYQTRVGGYGSRFSGGEKQRIAIARAILKNAPILLLDEATSAADPENQVEIDQSIQNLCRGKTVIIVAHRLGALRMCDRIAVVENKKISAVGSHTELLNQNQYYQKVWQDYEQARNIIFGEGRGCWYDTKSIKKER